MSNREKYKKILSILSGKKFQKIIKRNEAEVADLVGRYREELGKPDLAVNSISVILEKIQSASGGGLPIEVQKILDSMRHNSTSLNPVPCKLSKADIWHSDVKRWGYKK
jgi:hypothetical protein